MSMTPLSTDRPAARITRSSKSSIIAMGIALLAIAVLAAAPVWAGRAELRLLGEIYLYLSLACLWNLMAGYAGLVSVGQQAYVGFGGYLLFALTMFAGLHPILAILLSGLFAALISIPVAALIFRLHGAYFAIGTWVISEVFRLSFAQISALGGGSGTSLPVNIVKSIAASRALSLMAIRDSEIAAEGLGINIWRTKLEVYVVTAALTAIVGGLIFLQKLRISPDAAFSVCEKHWQISAPSI